MSDPYIKLIKLKNGNEEYLNHKLAKMKVKAINILRKQILNQTSKKLSG